MRRSLILLIALLVLAPISKVGGQDVLLPPKDTNDSTIWPNRASKANSDKWLVRHHQQIKQMRPRLLVLNFSNQHTMEHTQKMTQDLIAALAESSRYHGYQNKDAPIFLQYSVLKYVDLRDSGATKNNSSKTPRKPNVGEKDINFDYNKLFSEEFAPNYGFKDPQNTERFLRLDELVDKGYIHEVWFFSAASGDIRCFECIELKPVFDQNFQRTGAVREAGNGEDPDRKWTGRSLRINNLNPDRGIGCAMENLAHCLEGMANYDVIPYYTKYFREFAQLDLDKRFNLPFKSFYDLEYGKPVVNYPNPQTAEITYQGKQIRLKNYRVKGGNAHWTPNGRQQYDLRNEKPVFSCIEDWRIGSGENGDDRYELWTNQKFEKYRKLAPDCMGPWIVYWRQNIPGLNNRQKDVDGKPMKNWWVFLFY